MPIIKTNKTENVGQIPAARVSNPRFRNEKAESNTKPNLNEEKLIKKDEKKNQAKLLSGFSKSVSKTLSRPVTSQNFEQKTKVKCCPFKSATLNSHSDNRSFIETFHTKSVKGLGCTQNACRGSILKDGILKLDQQKDETVAKSENLDFLNQYYESINKKNSNEHKERIKESEVKFKVKGHYELTFDELEFACRTAWRNAARCIGRINWSKIKLFDGRNCTTTKEIFEKLCDHIQFATNNGNLRSAITVFRQRTKGKPDIRIWNSQLINYAGYEINETETIGDKSQIEFTKICEKLGWKSKKKEFEVLPLILQIGDQKPELYELPEDLLMQVDLIHPKYESFKDLKLKWYAVPLVSSLVLDAGGIYYNCTAFNGWYMNTEIGRDLTEPNRFDKLRVIAQVLGLNMNTNVSLWKDEVLLELNKAILYSFNKAGVTIVDHHSASESFVKHWENEMRIRGGTPADWIWINPPLTSHITPLFGMEMINYVVKPYFEYQEMPRLSKKLIKFKTLIKSIVPFLLSAFKKIKNRPKCCILYASQTGKSKNFAEITYNVFKNVFNVKLICINDYNFNDLDKENLILAIASTTGNGDSPTNGKSIEEIMNKIKKKQITSENNEILAKSYTHVRFSVLGFGDSTYCYSFGAYPKLIEKFYKYLGLNEIYPINIADQVKDEEKTMYTWLKNCLLASYTEFKEHLSIKQVEIDKILGSNLLKTKKIFLRSSPFSGSKSCINDATINFSKIYEKNLKRFEIIEKEVIGYQPNNQKILRIKLRSKGFDVAFIPGNHIEIFGQNRKDYVDFILSRLNNNPNFDEPIKFEIFDERYSSASNELWLINKKYPIMSIRQALTEYFDITKPLTQDGLKMLASQALNEKDRESLELLATNWKAYEDWVAEYPNLVDVLKTFFSVNPDINTLIAVLPHMKSRFYSISSSKKVATNEFDITIGVYQYESTIYNSIHYGVCSKFLEDAPIGTVIPGEIISGNKFTMPEDQSLPIIMICTGCGIAPFRSFWTERARDIEISKKSNDNRIFGDFILLYGCREKQKDFLYMNEIESLSENNVFTGFYTAFSRDQNYPKEYVQDKLEENAEEFVDLILNKNAHIYVCGRKFLANEVIEKLRTIFSLGDKFESMDEIDSYIQDLKANNRYHEDLFNS